MPRLRLALGQTNPIVGDLDGNSAQILAGAPSRAPAGADLLAVGEMALSGYPIEDLAARPSFLRASTTPPYAAREAARRGRTRRPAGRRRPPGRPVRAPAARHLERPTAIAQNCASVLHHGRVVARYAKHHLPNYSVFDEYRIFIPGDELLVLRSRGRMSP